MNADEYYQWAKQLVDTSKPEAVLQTVERIVRENDEWRTRKCINLNAAESVLSPRANLLLQSDLERRAAPGELGARHHKGARYVDQLDAIVTEQAKKVFRVSFAEHRPVTTSVANALALRSLTNVGDTIMALEAPRGHPSWRQQGYAGFRGLNILDIPFDYAEWNIDLVKLRQLTEKLTTRPKVFVVGTSVFLFPHPLKEIVEIASEVGAKVWYDAAHVLGLIAGGRFQDPIAEGAYMMTGTTSKTLSGPMGGVILHNDPALDKDIRSNLPGFISTLGHQRTAALAATLAEMSVFGADFAAQIISNAKVLARALDEEGFDVVGRKNGYTESHTILFDVSKQGGGDRVSGLFEKGNIVSSAYKVWSPDEAWAGVRIGVTEVTRLGMKEAEMKQIARFMRQLAREQEDPENVAKEVADFRGQFTKVRFCFD